MLITFDDQEYKFGFDEVDLRDAIYIQNQFGLTMTDLYEGFRKSDPKALLAIYWLMGKQNGKTFNLQTVNFKLMKFDAALTEAMVAEAKATAEANPTGDQNEVTPETNSG